MMMDITLNVLQGARGRSKNKKGASVTQPKDSTYCNALILSYLLTKEISRRFRGHNDQCFVIISYALRKSRNTLGM